MTISSKELADALVDVRKAYRLIHAYQQRIWDLLRTTDRLLSDAGLPFQRWQPQNVLPPPRGGTRFFTDRWVWDFIPAYQLSCQWQGTNRKTKFTRRVYLIAIADTGYDPNCKGEPDSKNFEDAEKSRTELSVGLWTATTPSPDWNEAWAAIQKSKHAHDGKTHSVTIKGTTYTYRYLRIDVAELIDDEAVKTRLRAPIEAWLDKT